MKALIRDDEVIPETEWNDWIVAHLDWMTTETERRRLHDDRDRDH